jgi:Tol biopolymer transport system component
MFSGRACFGKSAFGWMGIAALAMTMGCGGSGSNLNLPSGKFYVSMYSAAIDDEAIHTINLRTRQVTRLNTGTQGANCPAASGDKLYFIDDNNQLHRANLNGTGATLMGTATNTPRLLEPSPDGQSLVYYTFNPQWAVRKISVTGSPDVQLAGDGNLCAGPSYAPDGRIFFTWITDGEANVWVMNGDGTNKVNLTPGAGDYGYNCEVAPDGSKVAYEGPGGIRLMNLDGSGSTLIASSVTSPFPIGWTPDSQWIILSDEPNGSEDRIVAVKVDGSVAVEILRVTSGHLESFGNAIP